MTFLLYFVSYGAVLVLFTSATVLIGWALLALLDSFVRRYLAITQPETRPAKKRTWDYNPNVLKRAGQW